MSFAPVRTLDDLFSLDVDEIVAGYTSYENGDPEPGPNRGRAFWHGWRNASRDRGQLVGDDAMAQLAHDFARAERSGDPRLVLRYAPK